MNFRDNWQASAECENPMSIGSLVPTKNLKKQEKPHDIKSKEISMASLHPDDKENEPNKMMLDLKQIEDK